MLNRSFIFASLFLIALTTPCIAQNKKHIVTTPAPLPAKHAAVTMQLPKGFTATAFANEPAITQPISFCIDDRGRLWVVEAYNYGKWQPTGKDRIVILEDTDKDGVHDKRTVFYEGINYATGIEYGFGGVWIMSPPSLLFIPDKNHDDKPDSKPQVLLDGFGHKQSRHNLANGFTWGPDGWLYFGHGRTSPSDVGKPGTPKDKRIHTDGGVCRVHPTRLSFETFADGSTNPWGVDFDDYGSCFVSNCVTPHLFHMVQGGHYEPFRNRKSSQYAYKRIPTCADHKHYPGNKWTASRGGAAEVLALGGGHAHCGTLIYLGDNWPNKYRNTVLMCNVHGKRINNDILKRKGASYVASHGKDVMISKDPWFMGVTLKTGPDGSVFVSDWSDTGECHTPKPNKTTGRIFKIKYQHTNQSSSKQQTQLGDLKLLTNRQLVQLQLHPNDYYVRRARRLLQERSTTSDFIKDAITGDLNQILSTNPDITRQLRALWALHATGHLDERQLAALLIHKSEYIRAWAVQLLCESSHPEKPITNDVNKAKALSTEILKQFATLAKNDPSAFVRLYLASALQRLPLNDRWPVIEALLTRREVRADSNSDANDPTLPLMYWYALEPLVAHDRRKALAVAARTNIPLIREFIARRIIDIDK